MANVDSPFGFKPIRYRSGAPYNGAANLYYFPTGDTTAAFVGDLVTLATSFYKLPEGVPMCKQAAATATTLLGVVVSILPNDASDTVYRKASEGRYALVADDPNLVFEAQYTGTLLASQMFYYCDVTVGTGSTVTGISAMEVNHSGIVTTTMQLHIVGISSKPNNTATDANPVLEVTIHEHAHKFAA